MKRTTIALGIMALAMPAFAQTTPPVPGWQQGRPDSLATSPLAPHAPRLTVTPADQIPIAALRVPAGFQVELWAHGMPGARMLAQGEDGTVFVGTRTIGRVYAVTDANGQRGTRTIAERLTEPNGIAIRDGNLYVIAINRVLRYDGVGRALTATMPTPVDLTAAFALPTEAHHGWKFAAFGPDGRLYMNVGAPCNHCVINRDTHALIVSFNPDGSDRRIETRGIRNSVGFDWNPATRELWATNNGRDWAGNDMPQDSLHRIRATGRDQGFPFCVGSWPDPNTPEPRVCSEFDQPAALLGSHVAPLGMRFYTGTQFPAEYRNAMFIAEHGSWNRDQLSGFQVTVARLDANGGVASVEPFLTGLRNDGTNRMTGRPTDVLVRPDGSLLVSDELNGAIYRITHR